MPLPQFGTLTTFDTLQTSQQTIAQFGEDNAWDGIASMLDSYNAQLRGLSGPLIAEGTERIRRYGGTAQMAMQRMDEFGTPNVQKGKNAIPVGFPMENYGIAIQWTRNFAKTKPVSELAAQVQLVATAATRKQIQNIKIALFTGINYNFTDYLVDHLDVIPLPVKALLNADGTSIPPGPNGEQYDGTTHTHYLASATLTNAFAKACLETVVEHYNEGQAVIWINRADETAWRALADFKALTYDTTLKATNQEYAVGTLNRTQLYNRQIGYFNGAEVWVKPWMIANYMFTYVEGVPQPLYRRVRGENANGGPAVEGAGDLNLVYEDEIHPLRATAWEQEYGISVWNRSNGSIGYYAGSTYTQPVIN